MSNFKDKKEFYASYNKLLTIKIILIIILKFYFLRYAPETKAEKKERLQKEAQEKMKKD